MTRDERLSNLYFDKVYTLYRAMSSGSDIGRFLESGMRHMAGGLMVVAPGGFPTADYFFAWQKRMGITSLDAAIKAFRLASITRALMEDREEKELGLDDRARFVLHVKRFRECNSSRYWKIFSEG